MYADGSTIGNSSQDSNRFLCRGQDYWRGRFWDRVCYPTYLSIYLAIISYLSICLSMYLSIYVYIYIHTYHPYLGLCTLVLNISAAR